MTVLTWILKSKQDCLKRLEVLLKYSKPVLIFKDHFVTRLQSNFHSNITFSITNWLRKLNTNIRSLLFQLIQHSRPFLKHLVTFGDCKWKNTHFTEAILNTWWHWVLSLLTRQIRYPTILKYSDWDTQSYTYSSLTCNRLSYIVSRNKQLKYIWPKRKDSSKTKNSNR